MQPDVTPFFTIATTSSGLPNIAIRFWKEHCASGYEPSFGRSARKWGYRSSRAFCPRSMSTCSSRNFADYTVNARGGQSNHNFGIAWDVGILDDGKYLTGNSSKEA